MEIYKELKDMKIKNVFLNFLCLTNENTRSLQAGAVKDYIKMMLDNDKLKFLVFAHHLSMLQACTEAVIESKVKPLQMCTQIHPHLHKWLPAGSECCRAAQEWKDSCVYRSVPLD